MDSHTCPLGPRARTSTAGFEASKSGTWERRHFHECRTPSYTSPYRFGEKKLSIFFCRFITQRVSRLHQPTKFIQRRQRCSEERHTTSLTVLRILPFCSHFVIDSTNESEANRRSYDVTINKATVLAVSLGSSDKSSGHDGINNESQQKTACRR